MSQCPGSRVRAGDRDGQQFTAKTRHPRPPLRLRDTAAQRLYRIVHQLVAVRLSQVR
jgi:hypothetical protein